MRAVITQTEEDMPKTGQQTPPEAELWYLRARADEDIRRVAMARLGEHLEVGARLVARCEAAAETSLNDGVRPLLAAARLVRANAEVAQTLARLASMERRRRPGIFEATERSRPDSAELNAKKFGGG